MVLKISAKNNLRGVIKLPGDKSISHRAIMLGAIAQGKTEIKNLLEAEDLFSTISCFRRLGIKIEKTRGRWIIQGQGLKGLSEPEDVLNAFNSGTTMRLILGILSAQEFYSVITGDRYLRVRPMQRVVKPLRLMGANIWGKDEGNYPPLSIKGGRLKAITYHLPLPSAQVKSCLLLAGLYAQGETKVIEKVKSRNHTEKMLNAFGAKIKVKRKEISIQRGELRGAKIIIPGDLSAAAFFIGAGLITKDSKVTLSDVGVNPTRSGCLGLFQKMGGGISLFNQREYSQEPVADIEVRTSNLKGVNISSSIIPSLIDELPLIAVVATQAEGETKISGAKELRVKETDRIKAIISELRKMGAEIEEEPSGMIIKGRQRLKGARVKSFGDHRMAMSLAIAGLIAKGTTIIEDADCIATSFPEFEKTLEGMKSKCQTLKPKF